MHSVRLSILSWHCHVMRPCLRVLKAPSRSALMLLWMPARCWMLCRLAQAQSALGRWDEAVATCKKVSLKSGSTAAAARVLGSRIRGCWRYLACVCASAATPSEADGATSLVFCLLFRHRHPPRRTRRATACRRRAAKGTATSRLCWTGLPWRRRAPAAWRAMTACSWRWVGNAGIGARCPAV